MKKFMKGLLATTMVFAMMTSLAGCGGDAATDDSADAKKETLTMATNATFPPYEYYEGQDIVGIDAEIGQALADKLGMDFKIEDMEFHSCGNQRQGKHGYGRHDSNTGSSEKRRLLRYLRNRRTGNHRKGRLRYHICG